MTLLLILGFGVGLALGLTGGGGMLAVPALILGLGMTFQEAMPVALLAICFSAMIGTIDGLKKRIVRYKAGIVMAAAGIAIAPFGIFLANILPSNILTLIFSILLMVISLKVFWGLIKNTKPPTGHASLAKNCLINPTTGKFNWSPKCFFTMSGIGGFTGMFTGMLGVGGGFLIAPSIRYFSDLNTQSIVSTSLLVITLISAGTVVQALLSGLTIETDGLLFILTVILGVFLARKIAPFFLDVHLQLSFAILAMLAAIFLTYSQFLGG